MSEIRYTPPASSGGTTINPTNYFIPIRVNATTFDDSVLYQQGVNQALKTTFGGSFNGLVVDDANKNYILGSYALGNQTYTRVNDASTYIAQFTNGTERMRINSSGNVGIGTTTPTQLLQIGNGSGTGNQYIRVFSPSSDIYIGQSGSGLFGLPANQGANIASDNVSYPFAIGTISSQPFIFGTVNAERMRITAAGNVGIGTTNPSAKLHISQTVGNTESIIDAIGGTPICSMLGTSSSVPLFGFNGTGLRFGSVTGPNAAGFSEHLRIASNGFVGIGVNNPTNQLVLPNTQYIAWQDSTGIESVGISCSNSNALTFFNVAERMRITSAGRVGIGTTTPSREFEVNGLIVTNRTSNGDGAIFFGALGGVYLYSPDSGGYLATYTGGIERTIVTSAGLVGIGTSSPVASAQLQVVSPNSDTGFLCPQLEDASIRAIVSPAEGLMVYNTDIAHVCFYQGGSWVKISSSPM